MKKLFLLITLSTSVFLSSCQTVTKKIDETKVLINDILQPDIAAEYKFDFNSKLKKIDELLTLISKSNDNVESVNI